MGYDGHGHLNGFVQFGMKVAGDGEGNGEGLVSGAEWCTDTKGDLFQMIGNKEFRRWKAHGCQRCGNGERLVRKRLILVGLVVQRDVRADGFVLVNIDRLGGFPLNPCAISTDIFSPALAEWDSHRQEEHRQEERPPHADVQALSPIKGSLR